MRKGFVHHSTYQGQGIQSFRVALSLKLGAKLVDLRILLWRGMSRVTGLAFRGGCGVVVMIILGIQLQLVSNHGWYEIATSC